MRILITGGAGFVGSNLALSYRTENPHHSLVIFDNLRRRGSETNVNRLKAQGIEFVHGDLRNRSDLFALEGNFDLFIEASAEPSVHAGLSGSVDYLLDTNLCGTLNCLEFARYRAPRVIFLSTSRVYSIQPLRQICLDESSTRFEISSSQLFPGISANGISEEFPTHLPRSLYGATKLASELILQEYAESFGLAAVINRCGVLAGAGQFGKTDQGVFTLWVAHHHFQKPLKYTGFKGQGKQVRDLLHPLDLFDLIQKQVPVLDQIRGQVFNVGGGCQGSTSLLELTSLCQEATGRETLITQDATTASVDIPLYISDSNRASTTFGWNPSFSVKDIVKDIAKWIQINETQVRELFR